MIGGGPAGLIAALALAHFKVPTTLVVYPNEGHLINQPANARDYVQRSLEWFDQWFAKAAK